MIKKESNTAHLKRYTLKPMKYIIFFSMYELKNILQKLKE